VTPESLPISCSILFLVWYRFHIFECYEAHNINKYWKNSEAHSAIMNQNFTLLPYDRWYSSELIFCWMFLRRKIVWDEFTWMNWPFFTRFLCTTSSFHIDIHATLYLPTYLQVQLITRQLKDNNPFTGNSSSN